MSRLPSFMTLKHTLSPTFWISDISFTPFSPLLIFFLFIIFFFNLVSILCFLLTWRLTTRIILAYFVRNIFFACLWGNVRDNFIRQFTLRKKKIFLFLVCYYSALARCLSSLIRGKWRLSCSLLVCYNRNLFYLWNFFFRNWLQRHLYNSCLQSHLKLRISFLPRSTHCLVLDYGEPMIREVASMTWIFVFAIWMICTKKGINILR